MSDPLMEIPGKIDKPRTASELLYHDYLMDFTNETLIPVLNKMFTEQKKDTEHQIEDMQAAHEKEMRSRAEVTDRIVDGIDKQQRESWRGMHETMRELRDEIKDSRAAKEQLQRVTINLENATEKITDVNQRQDETIVLLQTENRELKTQLNNHQREIEILNKSYANMVETLMGNAAAPGAIARIDENARQIEALKQSLDTRLTGIEKHLIDLSKPRGVSALFDWVKRHPAALILLGAGLSLIIHP